ncbi:putative internal virion protein [Rhizobium phage RHph_I20]|uniref:Putative internal virion protein n=1 Tax=Rhizobium phage RHph_I20 TaxID=2509730 RepID=A0A7S5RGQ1_9CAUD|nr:putative internal virion protein [Rhizobium phage RHph_I20]
MADNNDELATARQFLYGRTNKPQSAIDGLRGDFATKLSRMMQDPDAPVGLGLYSGYRSPERQAELWAGALKKYGSPEAARKWVAPPGHSMHNEGLAADMGYNGQSLQHAPKEVVDWVHSNADRYGLKFPLGNEAWHIEDSSTRGGKPTSVSDQAFAAGGFQQSGGTYQPVTNPPVPDWVKDSAPNDTFQTTPNVAPPTWGAVGSSILHSMPTYQVAQWVGNGSAAPDMPWLNNPDLGKFGKTLDGLNDDEQKWVIGTALSPQHAVELRSQLDQQKVDAGTATSSPTAFAGMLVANVLDPVSLAASAATGPAVVGASNVLRASTAAGVLTRMAEAGTIGIADATLASVIQAQVDPNFGVEDYVMNGLTGMALGAGIGTLTRGAELDGVSAEATAAFGRRARDFIAQTAEDRGYKFASPEARDAFTGAGKSAGAAENIASAAELFPDRRGFLERMADRLGSWSSNENLLMNKTGTAVRGIYEKLMPNLSGTGGRELRASEDAWSFMKRSTEVDHANMEKTFSQHFDGWLKESGMENVSFLKRDHLEEEFSQRVYYAMAHPDVANGSEAIEKMADAYRSAFGSKLDEAKALGVSWAQDVPKDDYYVPFKVSKRAYYEVTAKIGRDGLIDVIKQAFLRAQPDLYKAERAKKPGTKGRKLAADVRERKVSRLAERYLKMIEDTNIDNNGAERMTGLAGDSARALRDMLTEEGVGLEEIEDIISAFGWSPKEGPSNFRRRAVMERDEPFIPSKYASHPNARDYAVSLRQITDQDIRSVYSSYSRSVNGHLALAKAGFKSEADARAQIKDATNFRTTIEKGPEGKQNVFEQDMTTASEELNYFVDRILGRPAFPGVSKKTRLALSLVKNLGFIRFMQQSGISQLGDMPKILLRYGIGATWRQSRMRDFLDVFTYRDTEANALTREIQASTGIGIKTKNAKMYALHEDINIGGELFDEDLTTKMLAKANAVSESASRLTATVSLLNPITDTLQLWAARAASQRLIDIATGRKVISRKWMNEIGINERDLADMREIAKRMTLEGDGKIVRWNSDKQRAAGMDHADAYDRFLALVRRETQMAILETAPNAIKRSMSGPMMGLFWQLKSYMMNALLANTAKNIKLGPAYMSMSLVATSVWSAAIYAGQQYSVSLGMPGEDRKKFLEDRLSLRGILSAGFQRSADSSILPMIIDTTISGVDVFTGEDHRLFSNTRNSGLGSNITDSIPALRMVQDMGKLAKNVAAAAARTDQRFDQTEGRQMRDFIPLLRTYGLLNATNALIATMPPDTDGAIVKAK